LDHDRVQADSPELVLRQTAASTAAIEQAIHILRKALGTN